MRNLDLGVVIHRTHRRRIWNLGLGVVIHSLGDRDTLGLIYGLGEGGVAPLKAPHPETYLRSAC